jgi:hypothetical protein
LPDGKCNPSEGKDVQDQSSRIGSRAHLLYRQHQLGDADRDGSHGSDHRAATEAAQSARDSAALDKVGFFRRESSIRGAYFITPDQIDQQKPVRLSDIVRQVPVLVETVGRTGPVLRGVQGCLISYVDGLPRRSMFPGDLDSYVSARDVVAVEVYGPGQTAPAPFLRAGFRRNCTTLAIWTRSGWVESRKEEKSQIGEIPERRGRGGRVEGSWKVAARGKVR